VQQSLDRLMNALARSDAFAASKLVQSWWGQPSPAPGSAGEGQQAAWVAALTPGSEGALQAARWLLTGQLLWEGFLLPDLPARLQRQDAWRGGENPNTPLEKGVSLSLTVDLPGLGPLRVTGQQWGADLQLQVSLPPGQEAGLRQRWGVLQARLQSLNVGPVQLQESRDGL
jgi:hypothetical protein